MAFPPPLSRLLRVMDFLYPPVCMLCHADVASPRTLCPECWPGVQFLTGAVCDGCARPIDITWPGESGFTCESCAGQKRQWHRARAAALYEGGARELVLALKHGGRADLAPAMAGWMTRAAQDILREAELIIPVPLHWHRRLARRLNQSAELARRIARLCGRQHGAGILRRTRPTESQRAKTIAQRHRNVAGAFAVSAQAKSRIAGRRVVVVDDVMTTGATLGEASRILRLNGAHSVDVLVFARA